jgi:hypothetical protein
MFLIPFPFQRSIELPFPHTKKLAKKKKSAFALQSRERHYRHKNNLEEFLLNTVQMQEVSQNPPIV